MVFFHLHVVARHVHAVLQHLVLRHLVLHRLLRSLGLIGDLIGRNGKAGVHDGEQLLLAAFHGKGGGGNHADRHRYGQGRRNNSLHSGVLRQHHSFSSFDQSENQIRGGRTDLAGSLALVS